MANSDKGIENKTAHIKCICPPEVSEDDAPTMCCKKG